MKTSVEYVVADVVDYCGRTKRVHLRIRTNNGNLMANRLRQLIKDGALRSVPNALLHEMAEDLQKRWEDIPPMVRELIDAVDRKRLSEDIYDLRNVDFFPTSEAESSRLCSSYFTRRKLLVEEATKVKNTSLYRAYIDTLKENEKLHREVIQLHKKILANL